MSDGEDSDAADVVERWSAAIGELYLAWVAVNPQFVDPPAAGTPAWRDDVAIAQLRPELTKPEGTGAGIDAAQMIDAAAQHLLALKVLLDNKTLVLAPWPLARAAAEHVAHAAWLLEPGITAEARIARRWMARLAAAYRYRWMVAARKATRAEQTKAKNNREAIRAHLVQRFPDAITEWTSPSEEPLPPWTIAGEQYPTLGKQSKLIEKFGVNGVAGLYDTLSLVSHPNPMTLTMHVVRNDAGGRVAYRVDAAQWISIIRGACMLTCAAAYAIGGYFGADTSRLDAWFDEYAADPT